MTKRTSQVRKTEKQRNRKCFVITPIGNAESSARKETDGLLDTVIIPVASKTGYDVTVSHRDSESGSITSQIVQRLISDDLVIANLTGLNPNVMYELAVRHCKRLPVISMAKIGTKLPFDLQDERTIFYSDDMHGAAKAKLELETSIVSCQKSKHIDNPVTRAVGAKLIQESNAIPDSMKYLIERVDSIQTQMQEFGNTLTRRPAVIRPRKNPILTYSLRLSGSEELIDRVTVLLRQLFVIRELEGSEKHEYRALVDLNGREMAFARSMLDFSGINYKLDRDMVVVLDFNEDFEDCFQQYCGDP